MSHAARSILLKGDVEFKDTYSVPMPLILKREYILIETITTAIEVSVQIISISNPPLSWSPPLGTGSEAIGIMIYLRNKHRETERADVRKGRNSS